MKRHLMLDIETMDVSPTAAIVAIGAACGTNKRNIDTFYTNVSLESSIQNGGTINAGTILWWLKQPQQARDLCFTGKTLVIESALREFTSWYADQSPDLVWGNGAAFDITIIRSSYERLGLKTPWIYKQDTCYRTLASLYPNIKIEYEGVAHYALDDATNQLKHLFKILKQMAN